MDDEMGCECGTYGDKKNTYKDWVKNHEGMIPLWGHRRRWEANTKILFRNGVWTILIWLRIRKSDGLLWTTKRSCGLHQTLRISGLPEELIFLQENSVEYFYKCSLGVVSGLRWLGRLFVIKVISLNFLISEGDLPHYSGQVQDPFLSPVQYTWG